MHRTTNAILQLVHAHFEKGVVCRQCPLHIPHRKIKSHDMRFCGLILNHENMLKQIWIELTYAKLAEDVPMTDPRGGEREIGAITSPLWSLVKGIQVDISKPVIMFFNLLSA